MDRRIVLGLIVATVATAAFTAGAVIQHQPWFAGAALMMAIGVVIVLIGLRPTTGGCPHCQATEDLGLGFCHRCGRSA